MNAYKKRYAMLVCVALTALALYSHRFLPETRFELTSNDDFEVYLYGTEIEGSRSVATWLNESERSYRCFYPQNASANRYSCSINLQYIVEGGQGVDLSRYSFALAMAEKIRLRVQEEVFESEEPLLVTVSLGVGSLMEDEAFSDVFKRVDSALYDAKNNGRNRVRLAEPHVIDKLGFS